MPITKRKAPKAVPVQQQSIEQAKAALQQLPEKPKESWSLREAIATLKGTITTALDRGYSYEEISEMLSTQGVKISPSSLKSYLASSRKEDKSAPAPAKAPRGRRKKVEEPLEVAAAPAPAPTPASATEEAPKPRRGRRPASEAAPTKTAAKTRGRTAKSAAPAEAPKTGRGRRKKTIS